MQNHKAVDLLIEVVLRAQGTGRWPLETRNCAYALGETLRRDPKLDLSAWAREVKKTREVFKHFQST
jgi:hypothetical protein